MDHIHSFGHTIDLFHLVSAPVVFQTHCRLLSYSLLPDVQVDHKCRNLTLDSFLFLSVVLCSCLCLCLLWLVVLAAIVAYLYLLLCCSFRSLCIRSLFLCCCSFLCLYLWTFLFLVLCPCLLLLCPLVLFRHQGCCWQLMIAVAILWMPLWFCSTPWVLLVLLHMSVLCLHWDVSAVVVVLLFHSSTPLFWPDLGVSWCCQLRSVVARIPVYAHFCL